MTATEFRLLEVLKKRLWDVTHRKQALNFDFNNLYDEYKQKYNAKRGFKKKMQESEEYKNIFAKLEELEKLEMQLQDEIRVIQDA